MALDTSAVNENHTSPRLTYLISIAVIVAEVVFMLLGFILGQIRTLQRLSWLANLAIWLNVIVIIMT
jgi:uncharacterized membrane protein